HLVLRSQRGTLDMRVGLGRASELLALFVYSLEQFALKAGTEVFDWFKRLRERRLFLPFLYICHMIDILPSFSVLLDAHRERPGNSRGCSHSKLKWYSCV